MGAGAWPAQSVFFSPSGTPALRRPSARRWYCALKVGSSVQCNPSKGLHGEAGIEFLQLGGSLLRLLVVASQGVGGGEVEVRIENLWHAGGRLVAPFDRLLPMLEMRMEVAHKVLPPRHAPVARAQSKRGFDPRKALLGTAEIYLLETGVRMGVGVVGVQRDRSFIPPRSTVPTAASPRRPNPSQIEPANSQAERPRPRRSLSRRARCRLRGFRSIDRPRD